MTEQARKNYPLLNSIIEKLRMQYGIYVHNREITFNNCGATIYAAGRTYFYEKYNEIYLENASQEERHEFVNDYAHYIATIVLSQDKLAGIDTRYGYGDTQGVSGFTPRKTVVIHYKDLLEDPDYKHSGKEFDYIHKLTFEDFVNYLVVACNYSREELNINSLAELWVNGLIDTIELEHNQEFIDYLREEYREDAENEYALFDND